MKKFVRLLVFFVCAFFVGTALISCVQGELYGQTAPEENGSGGNGNQENKSGWYELMDKTILLDGSSTGEYMILQSDGYLVWNNTTDGNQKYKVYIKSDDPYILLFYDYSNRYLNIIAIDSNGVTITDNDGIVRKMSIYDTGGDSSAIFYNVSEEGKQMTFMIIDKDKKWCQVGTGLETAISTSISGVITIPSVVKGYTVVKIADRAFKNCTGLTKVSIPNTVTEIGTDKFESAMGSFHGCSGITSFDIPSSVTSIGRGAFGSCTKITSFVVPESVTYIGSNAFDGCTNLTTIELSPNISALLLETFRYCSSLTEIKIPAKVSRFGNNVFQGCTSLSTITSLIESPFTIPESAFANYNATLYVPVGTKAQYQNTSSWNQFAKIIEIGSSEGGNSDIEDGPVNSYGGDGPYKASLSFADKVFNTSYVDWYWAAPTDYPYDENHQYVDSQGGIHRYDGHDYHILFSSYDTPKMLDAVYFNEGTFEIPEEITTIGIGFEEKKAAELPLGTYEGKKFKVLIWNERQVGTSYNFGYTPDGYDFALYPTAKMTITKDGNDYVITITDLTLRGGPIDSDGRELDPKYYTNISFTYKGPIPKLAEKYDSVIDY